MAAIRTTGRKAWEIYLIPGFVMAAIKFLSAISWFVYQPLARASGLSHSTFAIGDSIVVFARGLVAAAIAIVGWPLAVYKIAIGSASLSAVLFYPWVPVP